jgi:tRNA(adenine34) deaminase
MCAGALNWVQLGKLVYGASDLQRGFTRIDGQILHPKTELVKGIKLEESKALIDTFFKRLRE